MISRAAMSMMAVKSSFWSRATMKLSWMPSTGRLHFFDSGGLKCLRGLFIYAISAADQRSKILQFMSELETKEFADEEIYLVS